MHRIAQSIFKTYWNGTPGSSQFATSAEVISVVSEAIEGDMHDHLLSLLRIVQKVGWLDSHRYLCLGDDVDRGKSSCEVLVRQNGKQVLFAIRPYLESYGLKLRLQNGNRCIRSRDFIRY
jgi:hypothetical protein